MILLKAILTIIPKGRADFSRHIQTLIEASLAEDGCLGFGCYEDLLAPNTFIVLGEWRDRDALDKHEQAMHVAAFKAGAAPFIASRRETIVYAVSETSSLPFNPQSPIKADRAARH